MVVPAGKLPVAADMQLPSSKFLCTYIRINTLARTRSFLLTLSDMRRIALFELFFTIGSK